MFVSSARFVFLVLVVVCVFLDSGATSSSSAPVIPARSAASPVHPTPPASRLSTTSSSSSPRTTTSSPPGQAPIPSAGPTPVVQAPPTLEEVQSYIKKITHPIQQLLQDAQAHKEDCFNLSSIQIATTVDSLMAIFPPVSGLSCAWGVQEVLLLLFLVVFLTKGLF